MDVVQAYNKARTAVGTMPVTDDKELAAGTDCYWLVEDLENVVRALADDYMNEQKRVVENDYFDEADYEVESFETFADRHKIEIIWD